MWISLRKGGTHIHVGYGHGFTNNLMAHDVQVQVDSQAVELSLDLNPNLRVRNKATWPYIDARALADGDIARLSLVQLGDDHILRGLHRVLARSTPMPEAWALRVELEGSHRFEVSPEFKADLLWLNVTGMESV
ncbi:MAG: hypothetical protein ACYC6T_08250 [Thermoleophilia bacterium]